MACGIEEHPPLFGSRLMFSGLCAQHYCCVGCCVHVFDCDIKMHLLALGTVRPDGFTRDSGHFLYREVDGDYEVAVTLSGNFTSLYDQAGLMIRSDERMSPLATNHVRTRVSAVEHAVPSGTDGLFTRAWWPASAGLLVPGRLKTFGPEG